MTNEVEKKQQRKRERESIESGMPAKKKAKAALSWHERLAQLKVFKNQHGHCNVTQKYDRETAPGLVVWVHNQRANFPKEKKTEAGIGLVVGKRASLESIGFDWKPSEGYHLVSWDERLLS